MDLSLALVERMFPWLTMGLLIYFSYRKIKRVRKQIRITFDRSYGGSGLGQDDKKAMLLKATNEGYRPIELVAGGVVSSNRKCYSVERADRGRVLPKRLEEWECVGLPVHVSNMLERTGCPFTHAWFRDSDGKVYKEPFPKSWREEEPSLFR